MVDTTFTTIFQAPLKCESCVEGVTQALNSVKGIENVDIDLESQRIAVTGHVPPSEIVKSLQKIGKDAIVRGSGKPDSAAVCILETFNPADLHNPVKGIARIVEVANKQVVVDLTINGLEKGVYYPLIRSSGNLSNGPISTGSIFHKLAPLGIFEPCQTNQTSKTTSKELFAGQSFLRAELSVKDLIGRSMVISTDENHVDQNSVCGVIARSAGAWENDKIVCSCSGKNVWQERQDAMRKGITN